MKKALETYALKATRYGAGRYRGPYQSQFYYNEFMDYKWHVDPCLLTGRVPVVCASGWHVSWPGQSHISQRWQTDGRVWLVMVRGFYRIERPWANKATFSEIRFISELTEDERTALTRPRVSFAHSVDVLGLPIGSRLLTGSGPKEVKG